MNKLTKEIHYANGVKLVYNERARMWESRREPRVKQQFDNPSKPPQPQQSIHRIPATLTLKPLQNHSTPVNNVDIIAASDFRSRSGNRSDSDSDIEVVFESPKTTLNVQPKPQPQPEPQPFRNVSANFALKQIANNKHSINKFADDEIEVEVIRNSNRVQTCGSNFQRPVSKPIIPITKSLVNTRFESIFDLQQKLKFTNVTLTQQSNRNEHVVVPTQSIPVKPRISIKPPLSNITCVARPSVQTITIKEPQTPIIETKTSVETRKPPIKFDKCTETTLICIVCKCLFLNPGDSELESRLFGRFCCRKCNQFLDDCCNGKLDSDKFQCYNGGICDIGGDERCHYCWFDRAFVALNVNESQRLTSKELNHEEKKRKYVYESDSNYNGDKKSDVGSNCKFCGKYISNEYNMKVHWVHVHTEAIKDIQLPPWLDKLREQKISNRKFKKAMSDDEY